MAVVFNLLSQALTEERPLTADETSIIERRVDEYYSFWLRDNKPGEFYENEAFIDGITNYLKQI